MICLADSFTSIGILIVFGIGLCLMLLCGKIISKEDLIKLTRITKEDLDETVWKTFYSNRGSKVLCGISSRAKVYS